MKQAVVPAQYMLIARDLATRISRGDFQEGSKIYGRSVMASEYNVSPETIRRALRLLADMKVVEIRPQSCAVVLSTDNARRYIRRFEEGADIRALREQLRQLIAENANLQQKILDTATVLLKRQSSFAMTEDPLPNYEITIPENSPLIGQSIGALKFWQATGSTVVAIRRGDTVILSPGPYAQLFSGDVIVLVGTTEAVEAAHRLIAAKE